MIKIGPNWQEVGIQILEISRRKQIGLTAFTVLLKTFKPKWTQPSHFLDS